MSQDVHTPRVIASVFLKLDARRTFLHFSAWRLPGTLRMDEEDGRPGPRARQLGRVDVLTDASTSSLCSPPTTSGFQPGRVLRFLVPAHPQQQCIRIHIRLKENCYENVPGK